MMRRIPSTYRLLIIAALASLVGWVTWQYWAAGAYERQAKQALEDTFRAIIRGDLQAAKKYAYGNEMELLGIPEDAYARYVQRLLEGYVAPDADVQVLRETLDLVPPKNDEIKRLQDRLREDDRRRPSFRVRISRSDGKPPIECPTFAIKGPEGWIVSTRAMVAWLEGAYSNDPRERYGHVLKAMQRAGIEKLCSPSGSWVKQERLKMYLDGRLPEKDIFELSIVAN